MEIIILVILIVSIIINITLLAGIIENQVAIGEKIRRIEVKLLKNYEK